MAGNKPREDQAKEAKSIGELTVSISADVSEALTGLKAIQREARKATRAIRELEAAKSGWSEEFEQLVESHMELARKHDDILAEANKQLAIQGYDGNWNYDEYMHGMYNGMELIVAQMEDREPEFREAPDEWIVDKPREIDEPISVEDGDSAD
ncbi:hypothetical protein [Alteribacter populi]|uniref:hypothetical protein n=1 Tax=Alteribacter populi TaxID=2011011 RepID=UPI000D08B493|nr:hypothetical protein [Alteribacter populi]